MNKMNTKFNSIKQIMYNPRLFFSLRSEWNMHIWIDRRPLKILKLVSNHKGSCDNIELAGPNTLIKQDKRLVWNSNALTIQEPGWLNVRVSLTFSNWLETTTNI